MAKVRMHEGENIFVGGVSFLENVYDTLEQYPEDEVLELDLCNFYLDSYLIGMLLAVYASCKKRGKTLKLENLSPQSMKVITLSGLADVLGIEHTETEHAV